MDNKYIMYKGTILELYERSGRNGQVAERLSFDIYGLNITRSTIMKYWKEEGYVIRPRGSKGHNQKFKPENRELSDVEKAIARREYYRYDGNPNLASKSMGMSPIRIIKRWNSAGLLTQEQQRQKERLENKL